MEFDKHRIDNSEMLYRVVRNSDPNGFINGIPSAALFMDEKGVSVDRDGGREEKVIIDKFIQRFGQEDYKSAVKITAEQCRSVDTFPNPIGNKKNKYHAEIWDTETERKIGIVKAMKLANLCDKVD